MIQDAHEKLANSLKRFLQEKIEKVWDKKNAASLNTMRFDSSSSWQFYYQLSGLCYALYQFEEEICEVIEQGINCAGSIDEFKKLLKKQIKGFECKPHIIEYSDDCFLKELKKIQRDLTEIIDGYDDGT